MEEDDENIKALHASLVKNNYPVPAYDKFVEDMADPENVKALHASLVGKKFPVPDYETFSADMRPKDKIATDLSAEGKRIAEAVKKKDQASSKGSSSSSSPVVAQTAPEAYLPATKKDLKQKNADAALNKFYDQITDNDTPVELGKAYETYQRTTGNGDRFDFLSDKAMNQQYAHDVPLLKRTFEGTHSFMDWKQPKDVFSAPQSRASYELYQEAAKFKTNLLKTKLDQLHDVPASTEFIRENNDNPFVRSGKPKYSTIVDEAYSIHDTLQQLEQAKTTGVLDGNELTKEQASIVSSKIPEYQAKIDQFRKNPDGAEALKLIDNINSLDVDHDKFKNIFGHFIAEDKKAFDEQAQIDKLYNESGLVYKRTKDIGSGLGQGVTSGLESILTIPSMLRSGNKGYTESGESWKDKIHDIKKSIDGAVFQKPSAVEGDVVNQTGGNIQMYDDNGKFNPSVTLPSDVSINTKPLLYSTAKMLGDMLLPIGAAGASSKAAKAMGVSKKLFGVELGGAIGLMSGSYVQSYTEEFDDAIAHGLSREDAASHARTSAGLQAALELVNPNGYLWNGKAVNNVIKELSRGSGKGLLRAGKFIGGQILGETSQEELQLGAQVGTQLFTDKLLGKENFAPDMNKFSKQFVETAVITALTTSLVSGSHSVSNPLYNEAVYRAAEDPTMIPKLLDQFKKNKTSPVEVRKVLGDIASVVRPEQGAVAYVDTANNIPLTKAQAEEKIANGNIGDISIYNDPEMEKALQLKHEELSKNRDRQKEVQATKLVKNEDGTTDIVLKSDPTKKVGQIKDGITTLLNDQPEVADQPIVGKKDLTIDDLLRDNQASEVTEDQAKLMVADKNPATSKLGRVITNIQTAMSSINPEGRLVMLNNNAHAVDVAKKLGYKVDDAAVVKGFYDPNTKTAFFVRNPNTTIHEAAIHPIVDMIKHEAPERYEAFANEIGNIVSGYDQDGKGRYYLKDAQQNYKGQPKETQTEEAVVHFLSDVAEGKFNERTGVAKVVEAIKKFIGINPKDMMINLNDPQTLQDFAHQIGDALSRGQVIKVAPSEDQKKKKNKSEEVKAKQEKDSDENVKFQIDAVHGSAHMFDHFAKEKIGQGYGKNKYGWGIYLTEDKNIGMAKTYASVGYVRNVLPKYFNQFKTKSGVDVAKKLAEKFGGDKELYQKELEAQSKKLFNSKAAKEELSQLNSLDKAVEDKGSARLVYDVKVHQGRTPDQYDYLNWKDVLSPEQVKKIEALGVPISNTTTGGEAYTELAQKEGSQKAASEKLLDSGIDGVKYPDQDTGHNNIVVFDPRAVSISQVVKFQQEEKKISPDVSNDDATTKLINNTKSTQDFFTDVVSGASDKYKPVNQYKKLLPVSKSQDEFDKTYSGFKGNFDEHIATSIPAFRDVQVKKGRAIIDMLPDGGTMVDIAGSEGGLVKSVTKLSDGKIKTINLDVNQAMKIAHEKAPVKGSDFVDGSFLQDYEEDGVTHKRWTPEKKVDVVHETMGFQFMSPQRAEQFAEVAKNFLKPDGVFITEQKVGNLHWDNNEAAKDQKFKSKYYTPAQIEQKNKDVKVSDFDANEGMAGNMVKEPIVLKELRAHFDIVKQYWDGGNFKGYIASNDATKVGRFMDSLGSTNSEFSNRNDNQLVGARELKGVHGNAVVHSINDAREFHDAIAKAVGERKSDGAQVEVKSIDDYQEILDNGGKLYLSDDNKFGAFVKADGYMGSLFKSPSSKESAIAKTMQDIRVKDGGRFFDAFGNHLEDIYIRNGFKPVARLPFNDSPEVAPAGWEDTTLKSKPDVVFFVYDPTGTQKKGDGKLFDDWQEAYEYAQHYNQESNDSGGATTGTGVSDKTEPAGEAVSQKGNQDDSQEGTTTQGEGAESPVLKFHQEVSKTTKRVIEPEKTPYQELRDQYIQDPTNPTFTTGRQSINDEIAKLASMSDAQALNNMADKGTHELYDLLDRLKPTDNFGLLAAIEVLKRATAANDQQMASSVFEKLNKVGSGVGQLLRQMRELKTIYPSANQTTRMTNDRGFIRSVIMKKYAKEGIVLPSDLKKELDGLISNYVAAHELEIKAGEKFAANPTVANSDAYNKAVDYTDKKHYDLIDFVDNTIPAGVGNTIWTIIKGNLLTAGSIAVNTISNVTNAANQIAIEGPAASLAGDVSKKIAGEKAAINPLNFTSAVNQAMGSFLKAWRPAFREAFTRGSMRSRDLQKFEIQRQLQPAKAFYQAFLNPNQLPKRVVNKNGHVTYKTTAAIWAEKAMEGTFGWPAAFFYRMLYLTDKPFKEAGKTFAGYLEYKSQNPQGKPSGFNSWMNNLDPKSRANIERYADKFTYNDREGMIASAASNVVGSVDKAADWMENLETPIPVVPQVMKAIKTAVVPYVGVPSNVVQHLLELAFPPAALASAVYHHRNGEHRIAGQMVGRALTGATLYAVASILSNAGLLIGNGDDPSKDKNNVQLKHALARPSAINLSGLIRLWAGGDPKWRAGDKSVDMQKLGMAGVFFNYYQNFADAMGKKGMEEFNGNLMDSLAQATGSTMKTAFSMSFLNGTFSTLESLAGADKEGAAGLTAFTAKTAETLSNLIWPNQLSQIHQAYNQDNLMRAYDPTLLGNIREKMAKRGFYFGALSTDKLEPVLDIWGQPIPVKPADILNPLKLEVATDPEAIKVWETMNAAHVENPITIPQNQIKLSGEDGIDGIETDTNMKLNEEDYLLLQSLVGRYKKAYLRNEFADPEFKSKTPIEKIQTIREANNEANTAGREMFLDLFMNEVEQGNVDFDAAKGTYTRKKEKKFDPSADEKAIADDGSEL
jgi:hypothetical protein